MSEDFPQDPSQIQLPEVAQPDPLRPKTAEELAQVFDSEISKPDSELAIQGIDNEIADVGRQRRDVDQSIAFTRGYRPRHPGPAPHPEAGGMDHEDYNAEAWEYANYDRDAELDKLDARDQELYGRIDELENLRKKVENGDATLTEKFSLAEKTRLEADYRRKLFDADRKVFDYDTRRGVELIGSRELLTSMEALLGTVGKDGQPKNGEWHHNHWATDEHDKVALRYSRDTFTRNQDGNKITIQIGAKAVPSNGAYYAPPNPDDYTEYDAGRLARLVEVTIDTPDYAHEGSFVHQGQKHAEYYGFRLYDDGRVAEQAKWNKGHRSESQIPNIIIGIEDIDKIQGYVNSINASDQRVEQ